MYSFRDSGDEANYLDSDDCNDRHPRWVRWRCVLLLQGPYRQTYFRDLARHFVAGTNLLKEDPRGDFLSYPGLSF